MKETLKFKNGVFRIALATDIHENYNNKKYGSLSRSMLTALLHESHADLIVLSGDIAHTDRLSAVLEPVDACGIPFAVTLGNHEPAGSLRRQYLDMCREYNNCLNPEPELPDGRCSTFFLPVYDKDRPVFGLWFCDTAPDAEPDGGEYITPEQIAWFSRKHNELKIQNGGTVLPGMWFQHIIFPEIYDALIEVQVGTPRAMPCFFDESRFFIPDEKTLKSGTLNEMPCALKKNYGMYDAICTAGGISAVFSGHDHDNDFVISHRGIDFVNTPKGCYAGSYNANHGIRLITLHESDLTQYETEIRTFSSVCSIDSSLFPFGNKVKLFVEKNRLHRKAEDFFTAEVPEYLRKKFGYKTITGERIWAIKKTD